jgi:hypothetical protein
LKIELTLGSETSAFKTQTPGNNPEDYTLYSQHGESLKSTITVSQHANLYVMDLVYNTAKKHNEPLLKGSRSNQKYPFCGLKQEKFIANDTEVLEFVLEKCKNGIPVRRQTIRMEVLEDAKS